MTAQTIHRTTPRAAGGGRRKPLRLGQFASQAFLICACVLWLLPICFALYIAVRPYSETQKYGYVSMPHHLTLKNFSDAWSQSDMLHYFWNSVLITVPSVIIVLALAAGLAFVLTRVNVKINVALLILFTAGNLLPQQVIITPLYRLYLLIGVPSGLSDSGKLYDTIIGLIVIHVAFQSGFCTFVLSNYMKTIPAGLHEAAGSSCRCSSPRSPRWPRCCRSGSTTTSSGPSC